MRRVAAGAMRGGAWIRSTTAVMRGGGRWVRVASARALWRRLLGRRRRARPRLRGRRGRWSRGGRRGDLRARLLDAGHPVRELQSRTRHAGREVVVELLAGDERHDDGALAG